MSQLSRTRMVKGASGTYIPDPGEHWKNTLSSNHLDFIVLETPEEGATEVHVQHHCGTRNMLPIKKVWISTKKLLVN